MSTPAQYAYEYLTAAGLPPEAATGVVGNLMAESGMNTRAVGDGGKAKGIAQWHPDRWGAFTSWASKAGRDPYSLEAQLFWVRKEAGTAAGGNVWDKLRNVKDVVQASALWMRLFERPKDQSDANARSRAEAGVKAVKGGENLYDPRSLPQVVGDGLGGVAGAAGDAVGGAVASGINQAATTLLTGSQPILIKGLFVALAVGLIGVGIVKATGAGRLVTGGA